MKNDELTKVLLTAAKDPEMLRYVAEAASARIELNLMSFVVENTARYAVTAGQVREVLKAIALETDFSAIIRRGGS